MLHFLSPIAFLALASLLVPLLIHLWSKGTGPRVQVGSLRFLEATEQRRLRTVRLTRIPLLLVRMLLLAVLVLLLARPAWVGPPAGAGAPEHWVLVHPDVPASLAPERWYRTLDSLAGGGATLRRMAPGFPPLDLDEVGRAESAAVDVWSLLREVDWRLPDGAALTVVAPSRLADLRGVRPSLRSPVAWITVADDEPNRWVEAARWIGTDSLWLAVGASRPTQTRWSTYRRNTVSEDPRLPNEAGFTVILDESRGVAALLPADAAPRDDTLRIAPEDAVRRFVVLHGAARQEDARYVAAALRAAAVVLPGAATITTLAGPDISPEEVDVLFWLHEEPVPDAVLARVRQGLLLVSDAEGGAWQAVRRRVRTPLAVPGDVPRLHRRVEAVRRGAVLWLDSAGEPLWEAETMGNGTHHRYHSRFHPTAGSLVRSALFPEWVWTLLHENGLPEAESGRASAGDRRRVQPTQQAPRQAAHAVPEAAAPVNRRLHGVFWMMAGGLFMLERWFAFRQSA